MNGRVGISLPPTASNKHSKAQSWGKLIVLRSRFRNPAARRLPESKGINVSERGEERLQTRMLCGPTHEAKNIRADSNDEFV